MSLTYEGFLSFLGGSFGFSCFSLSLMTGGPGGSFFLSSLSFFCAKTTELLPGVVTEAVIPKSESVIMRKAFFI